jgi:hypothetical protein
MQGVLTSIIELWSFESPGGLPSPIFESVNGDLTLPSKWGCDNSYNKKNFETLNFFFVIWKFFYLYMTSNLCGEFSNLNTKFKV